MIEILLQAERALSLGLLDRAESLYRQVADADPRNSIAVVGLARVALERGDDSQSLALGRRALQIDPENSAAQRLVQRLEEIRAYREASGTAVEDEPEPDVADMADVADVSDVAAEPAEASPPVPLEPSPAAPVSESLPEAGGEIEPEPEPESAPEPARSRWRRWLDRLFRRR